MTLFHLLDELNARVDEMIPDCPDGVRDAIVARLMMGELVIIDKNGGKTD